MLINVYLMDKFYLLNVETPPKKDEEDVCHHTSSPIANIFISIICSSGGQFQRLVRRHAIRACE